LAPYYPFSRDGTGETYYAGVRGPEYLRALRRYATDLGVRVRDHHPALELLTHRDGSVAGASGYARLEGRPWTIRAAACVLATGGCAFRSGLIGSHTNTGDGYLMGAEVGAELSGMEFSTIYSLSPAWCSTRTLPYPAARFFDAAGAELDIPPPLADRAHHRALAKAMLEGPVFADLSEAPAALKPILRRIQPATIAPFERRGVRLFEDRFEVKLFGEGTVRGTGGLRIIDDDCQTTVRGLFAAGDAATRELVVGASSGGGGPPGPEARAARGRSRVCPRARRPAPRACATRGGRARRNRRGEGRNAFLRQGFLETPWQPGDGSGAVECGLGRDRTPSPRGGPGPGGGARDRRPGGHGPLVDPRSPRANGNPRAARPCGRTGSFARWSAPASGGRPRHDMDQV
jgi:hypothetical protein